jgi:F-type H+-transporting ATPase subunit b
MMSTFFILATEAHAGGEGGFGLDFNILEANLINLAILIAILVYFGRKSLGQVLDGRRTKIAEAIQEAEERLQTAAGAVADEQQKLAQAQATAEKIRKEAEQRAQAIKAEILAQGEKDIERLKEVAVQDLNAEQERVIAQLRRQIVALAMEQAEAQLKAQLDESAQQEIVNRSIAQLGGRS